jgi:hypothetical protein
MRPWSSCHACHRDGDLEIIRLTFTLGTMCVVPSDDGVLPGDDGRCYVPEWVRNRERHALGLGLRCRVCGAQRILASPSEDEVAKLLVLRWEHAGESPDQWFGHRAWRVETAPIPGAEDFALVPVHELIEELGPCIADLGADASSTAPVELIAEIHGDAVVSERVLAFAVGAAEPNLRWE